MFPLNLNMQLCVQSLTTLRRGDGSAHISMVRGGGLPQSSPIFRHQGSVRTAQLLRNVPFESKA